VIGMFLHLGRAPECMRARELAQMQAVLEILRRVDEPRLLEAMLAEARTAVGTGDRTKEPV